MLTLCNRSAALFALLGVLLSACSGASSDKAADTTAEPAATTTTTTTPEITSLGTDFYLTLPDHICASDPASCRNTSVNNKLIIAAAADTSGEVTFNGVVTPYSVSAGQATSIPLAVSAVLTANETVENKGIHVTALLPVSVHVVSENSTSADGYLALPTAALGTHYLVMSYGSSKYYGSEFALVASEDATTVTITPTAAGASIAANATFSITLNRGQTYQFQNPASADLSGTLVTGDKPFAMISGHRCADVPSGTGYCDYLVEQIPATAAWGSTFHTTPFKNRARYLVRILASEDGTTITTSPAGLLNATLNAGQHVDITLSGAAEIVASAPILLAQFMAGYSDDASGMGDPGMVLITPAELGMTDTTFGVHGLSGTSGAFMNVITETAVLADLTLDDIAVNPANFTRIGSSTRSAATLPITAGRHKLRGSAPYSAMVYDYGIAWNAVSYTYPVATKIALVVTTTIPAPGPGPAPAPTPPSTGTPPSCNDDDDDHHHHHGHHHHHRGHHHGHGYGYHHGHDDDDNCP
jgi:hypothetical protein